MGELADQGIDLAEGKGRGGVPLEVAADEAVGRGAALQRRGARVVDDGGAVLLDQGEDPEDPPDAGDAVAAVDRLAQRADPGAGAGGPGQERDGGRRRAARLIRWRDGIAAGALRPVFAEELAGAGVEQAHLAAVPLDGDRPTDPPRRRGVVGAIDLDAAVEVDSARAVAVVAEGLDGEREEGGPLLGEHGGDLALRGAVDARIGPARLPAVEIHLGRVQGLEPEPLERRGLRVADGRLDFPFRSACRTRHGSATAP